MNPQNNELNVRTESLFNKVGTVFIVVMCLVSVAAFFYSRVLVLESRNVEITKNLETINFICADMHADDLWRAALLKREVGAASHTTGVAHAYHVGRLQDFAIRDIYGNTRAVHCASLMGEKK